MNDPQAGKDPMTVPSDPAMAAGDPAMFTPLTSVENNILTMHLTSGWYKQGAVYPTLSEPWKETCAVLGDLHDAHETACQAEREPEAGS
jgi:hypothetical protein